MNSRGRRTQQRAQERAEAKKRKKLTEDAERLLRHLRKIKNKKDGQ